MVDYKQYIQSEEWKIKAQEAKRLAANRCQICNRHESEILLDVHHRTYERLGDEVMEDLTTLCRDCHELYSREDRLAKYGARELRGKRELYQLAEVSDEDVGALTGLNDIDKFLGSLRNGSLTCIMSTPGMGKTAVACAVASHNASKGKGTIIFSLQMTARDMKGRLKPYLGRRKENELPLWLFDTPRMSAYLAYEELLKARETRDISLAVVDGAELLEGNKANWNRATELYEAGISLKRIARDLDLPIVVTVQVEMSNRADKRPFVEDLAKWGNWQLFSDVVIAVYRSDEVNPDATERASIIELRVERSYRGNHVGFDFFWDKHRAIVLNLERQAIAR